MADEKQQTSQVFRKYIIVVVDGIDKLKESSGKEELPEWLPNGIPNNVKIVVTCNKNSRSYNYLINKVSSHILIEPFDIDKRLELFEYYTRKLRSKVPRHTEIRCITRDGREEHVLRITHS